MDIETENIVWLEKDWHSFVWVVRVHGTCLGFPCGGLNGGTTKTLHTNCLAPRRAVRWFSVGFMDGYRELNGREGGF